MGRERRITIYVSSNSIVIEMIKKDTLSENRVILKNNFKIRHSFSSLFFFLFAKTFCLIDLSISKKKTKKKQKKTKKTLRSCLHSFECFEK